MRIVSAEQMRLLEREAIDNYGIPSIILMENAALAVVREVLSYLKTKNQAPASAKGVFLIGKGNNGGDGLAVARHLLLQKVDTTVFVFAKAEDFKGDALLNLTLYQKTGGKLIFVDGLNQKLPLKLAASQADFIIDALYGTGFRGALPSLTEDYVEEINHSKAYTISVDIPSGLEANTGRVYRLCVRADKTVTFGLPKLGHFLGEGPAVTGELVVDRISIPDDYLEREEVATFLLTQETIVELIPKRDFRGHKGTHGKGLLLAGSPGMTGAAVLAGRSALRNGIGLVHVLSTSAAAKIIDAELTEGVVHALHDKKDLAVEAWEKLQQLVKGANALAIGPGLGQNKSWLELIERVLDELTLPVVLDADALNLLAQKPELLERHSRKASLIMTPHPGEMARLCQCGIEEIQAYRLDTVLTKAVEWGAVVVLKGAMTIIATPDGRAFINPTGNPGLGTGGTGDVLTGSILAWLAQGLAPAEAACLAVYLHGRAGDELAQSYGESGYTATEVADMMPRVRRALEKLVQEDGGVC